MRGWLHLRIKYCFAQSLIEIWSDILQIKYEVKRGIYACLIVCRFTKFQGYHESEHKSKQSKYRMSSCIISPVGRFNFHKAVKLPYCPRCLCGPIQLSIVPPLEMHPRCERGRRSLCTIFFWWSALIVSLSILAVHSAKKTGDELCILDQSNWHAHIAVRNSSETNPKHLQLGFDIFGLWTLAVDLLLSLCQANPLLEWSPMMGWSTNPFVH